MIPHPRPRAGHLHLVARLGTAPTRVDQVAELIAICPRTANRPLLRITSRQRGRFSPVSTPGVLGAGRGESPGQPAVTRRRTRPPGSRPLRYWAHSTADGEPFHARDLAC